MRNVEDVIQDSTIADVDPIVVVVVVAAAGAAFAVAQTLQTLRI